jgi:hypothetical protein
MSCKRLKTLIYYLLMAVFTGGSPALAAGTVPLALSVQVDSSGAIASGCQLSFFVAGTVATPQNAFADFALTTPLSNPLPCDQSGRLPMFWLADGLIHIRLTTDAGSPIVDTTMQVLGASSGGGGGGGGTVDPTTILATGDLKVRYGTGPLSGFVRFNGLTIGSAVSGATERANSDTQAAFIYLYGADPNLAVSGGRTGNALNDYNANKTIVLPDWAGRAIAGLDDMGAGAKGRLTVNGFGTNATIIGAAGGHETQIIGINNISPFTPTVGSYSFDFSALHAIYHAQTWPGSGGTTVNTAFSLGSNAGSSAGDLGSSFSGSLGMSITMNTIGGGQAFAIASPMLLATIYMKL